MKMTVEVDCTPVEARAFLGLPDLTPLNDHMVSEMKRRMDENIAMLQPDELLKNWFNLGGQATEQFRKLMTAAATASMSGVGAAAGKAPSDSR